MQGEAVLTFKTQFAVDAGKGVEDLLECARIWISGSPHSELASQIPSSPLKDGDTFTSGEEILTCATYKDVEREIVGVRYEKREDGEITWITDVVGFKSADEFTVAVQLSVDSDLPVERLDHGKRPYVVKCIMQRLGGGHDGVLKVGDAPVYLRDEDISLAADIISAHANLTMPVVYISADSHNRPFIDAEQSAQWLSGMAHVVVEPSRSFSFRLMQLTYSENVYGGAVGIYWPDGIGKWVCLPQGKFASARDMQIAVARKVRGSLLSQRTKRECTWSFLQEMVARRRIQELRDSGSKDVDEYIKQFDAEIKSKDDEIQRLEAELGRSLYSPYVEVSKSSGGDLLLESKEQDLYQAERLDVIMEVLQHALDSAGEGRKRDVLSDLIASNSISGERAEILDRLKVTLRQYTSMTAGVRSELESLGFEVHDDGKHHKLLFRGDERYPVILSKTSSDWRAGMNAYSIVRRKLF